MIPSVTHLLLVYYNMANTPTRLYYETIERGNIVNKDTFDGIREDIESAIAAGQKEAIANTNISSYAAHKKTSGQSRLPKIEEDLNERGHWGSKAEFILSCVGFSVSCLYLLLDKFKRVCIKIFCIVVYQNNYRYFFIYRWASVMFGGFPTKHIAMEGQRFYFLT